MNEPIMRPSVKLSLAATAIRSDMNGFSRLAQLHTELRKHSNADITINLSRLAWFDGHLAAPLSIVIRHAEANGNSVKIVDAQKSINQTLSRNRFLDSHLEDKYKTTMPLTKFRLDQAVDFSLYAKQHLDRPEVPRMTRSLRGKFFEGVDELFANSALHSRAKVEISVCGQFYPGNDRIGLYPVSLTAA